MIVKIGVYEYEFEDNLCKLYEENLGSELPHTALVYIESEYQTEDMEEICRTHSKDEVYRVICRCIRDELNLCGVIADV